MALFACALGAGPVHAEASPAGEGLRPPFPMYRGREEARIHGSTLVEGTAARVEIAPALQGDQVQHDLVIANDGDETIELRDVKACKGCILEGYSRQIAPGGRGRVTLLLLTDSLGGQKIDGTVQIGTSDPARPRIEVDVSMPVKEFAALSPYRVWLKGSVGEPIVARCLVVPNDAYPFEITAIKARKGTWIDFSYATVERDGKRAYEITLTNTRAKPGPYQDVLFVQTDHPARPEFKIRVEGRIDE